MHKLLKGSRLRRISNGKFYSVFNEVVNQSFQVFCQVFLLLSIKYAIAAFIMDW